MFHVSTRNFTQHLPIKLAEATCIKYLPIVLPSNQSQTTYISNTFYKFSSLRGSFAPRKLNSQPGITSHSNWRTCIQTYDNRHFQANNFIDASLWFHNFFTVNYPHDFLIGRTSTQTDIQLM